MIKTSHFKIKPKHVRNHTYYFLNSQETNDTSLERDSIDLVKEKLKLVLGPIYLLGIYFFSPIFPRIHFRSRKLYLDYLIDHYTNKPKSLTLHVGSGVNKKKISNINLDIFDYNGVDVVADATQLPFRNSMFDSYVSTAVLEHISNPELMIKEAYRVLKKDGIIVTGVPFIQGFHASPHDYTRWTNYGLKELHERHKFKTVKLLPIAGPASSLTWILIDFFSLLFSFGSKKLFFVFYYFFSFIFIPIKFLDIILVNYSESFRISSFFVYIGKK